MKNEVTRANKKFTVNLYLNTVKHQVDINLKKGLDVFVIK